MLRVGSTRPLMRAAATAAQAHAQRLPSRALLLRGAGTGPVNVKHVRHSSVMTSPLNLPKWLEENAHLLQPPVNNHCVTNEHMTVMIVGGPNARTDYHINTTPEFFYQHKGAMLLKIIDPQTQAFRDVHINEGDMYLLPPNVPHNPVRFADTVGIVLEQPRPQESVDKLRWYCQNCSELVHEAEFHCTDLGTQIKEAVNAFKADVKTRTCKNCGALCDTAPSKKT